MTDKSKIINIIKEELIKSAKESTLKECHNDINIEVNVDDCCVIADIAIADWSIYVELPLDIFENNDLLNEYIDAIKYAIENHSRNLDLEFYLESNSYQVKSTPENIKLDI